MPAECPVCYNTFTDDGRRAYSVCPKGHTCCKDCVIHLMGSRHSRFNECRDHDYLYFTIKDVIRYNEDFLKCVICRYEKKTPPGKQVTFNWIPTRLLEDDAEKPKFAGIGVKEREKLSSQITQNASTVEQQITSLMKALKGQKSMLKDFQQHEDEQMQLLVWEHDSKTKELIEMEEKIAKLKGEHHNTIEDMKSDIDFTVRKTKELEEKAKEKIRKLEEMADARIKQKEEEAERWIQEKRETTQAEMYRIARIKTREELEESRKQMEEEIAELYAKKISEFDFYKQQTEEQLTQDQIQVGASIKARLENFESEMDLRRKQVEAEIDLRRKQVEFEMEKYISEKKSQDKEYRSKKNEEFNTKFNEAKAKYEKDLESFECTKEQFRTFRNLREKCIKKTTYFDKNQFRMITKEDQIVDNDEIMLWSMLQYFLSGRTMVLSLDEFFKHRHEQMETKAAMQYWEEYTPESFFFKGIAKMKNFRS